MLKTFSILYRFVLTMMLILFYVLKILVGVAGHSSDAKGDSAIVWFIIITFCTLTAYHLAKDDKLKSILIWASMLLVAIGCAAVCYFIFEMLTDEPVFGLAIPALLFVIVSGILCRELWRANMGVRKN